MLCLGSTHLIGVTQGVEAVGQKVTVRAADLAPIALRGTPYCLHLDHQWEVVADERPGHEPFRVSSRAYRYHILNADDPGHAHLMFHWHPNPRVSYPHLHTDTDDHVHRRMHVPTGRITVEAVVRFAIEELGATPAREDWRDVLKASESLHLEHRSWHLTSPIAPTE